MYVYKNQISGIYIIIHYPTFQNFLIKPDSWFNWDDEVIESSCYVSTIIYKHRHVTCEKNFLGEWCESGRYDYTDYPEVDDMMRKGRKKRESEAYYENRNFQCGTVGVHYTDRDGTKKNGSLHSSVDQEDNFPDVSCRVGVLFTKE